MSAGADAGGMPEAELVSLEEANAARERIFAPEVRRAVLRTPLVRLNWDFEDKREIYLKLENLQQISSFKIRGAMNAILCKDVAKLKENGVVTASAGNMGQGVAYGARQLGFACTVVVPDSAPVTKLEAMERLGAIIVRVPYEEWWAVLMDPSLLQTKHTIMGEFIHPVVDSNVMTGHASIGIELVEDLGADVDSVLIAYGGGGLTCGVASVVKALCTSGVQVFTVEPETACPVHDAFANGRTVDTASAERYRTSFVDGCGGKQVIPAMWPLVSRLADDALAVSLDDIKFAIRVMAERNRCVAEGAGAVALAAAMCGARSGNEPTLDKEAVQAKLFAGKKKIVCVVCGGALNSQMLVEILQH